MKIKIGDQVYSDEEYPMVVYFSDKDLEAVRQIGTQHTNRAYGRVPVSYGWSREQLKSWIEGNSSVAENTENTDSSNQNQE